jgi:hypothetical protein
VTVEDLKATPFATAEEIAPYVGVWSGERFGGPGPATPLELHVVVEGARVEAWVDHTTGPPAVRRQTIEYLKVLPDGLEFGYMNGMRPAGMIVYAGVRRGETLEGDQNFRGIVLPLPGGFMPPNIKFRLARVAGGGGSG